MYESVICNVKCRAGHVNSGLRKGACLIEGKGVEWRKETKGLIEGIGSEQSEPLPPPSCSRDPPMTPPCPLNQSNGLNYNFLNTFPKHLSNH